MLVLKFGGTSVGSPGAIRNIIGILKDKDHAGRTAAVVVSAFSGVTDGLIDMARKAAAGDSSYTGLATALKKRHLGTAAAFLKGEDRKKAQGDTAALIAELCRTLDGIALLGELSPRALDLIMSFGERLSASLLAHVFTAAGVPSAFLDTRPLIKTDSEFGHAQFFAEESFHNIRSFFNPPKGKKPPLQVCTGFIGSVSEFAATPELAAGAFNTGGGGTAARIVTATLGRGGSDLSAAIIGAAIHTSGAAIHTPGAAIGADVVEIWTDVDGILTSDPRLVKNAFRIDEISYTEAMELSHFGAKVIYPPTIKPALEKGIPIRILNTFNPESPGTRIVRDAPEGEYPIRGISSMNNVALVRVQGSGMVGVAGFSSRLFGALARKKINIIMITQSSSEYSICFAVLPADAPPALAAINDEFDREIAAGAIDPPVSEGDLAIIAVVGSRMKSTSGISGKVFHALGRNGVNVIAIAQGSSELNISAVISAQDEAKALNAIHEAFFLSAVRSVNLFLLGLGLIGGTLAEQIARHRETLAREHHIRINLVGAADFPRMIFRPEGLDAKKVKAILAEGGEGTEPYELSAFVKRMKALNLPNSAFCDCTASSDVAAVYGEILESAVSIVTPNKRANSGSLEYYRKLTGYSRDRGIPYLYETTVCAGLPVISTLRDLFLSGDKVRRIEAVLSGTLSFIFNNYDGSKTFSALVREAKAKGYTEPDPRDDLNAMDAARKALILARECGLSLEFDAVAIEPILPPACFKAKDVDAFFAELEKSDAAFEKRRAAAAAEGKALRYVAIIEEGAARISLRAESPNSPFRSLVDSDNIVVITTDRYSTLPMVIKGPGAGAQVTAGGVFADIVRVARTLV